MPIAANLAKACLWLSSTRQPAQGGYHEMGSPHELTIGGSPCGHPPYIFKPHSTEISKLNDQPMRLLAVGTFCRIIRIISYSTKPNTKKTS
jgi:hypothetical protein